MVPGAPVTPAGFQEGIAPTADRTLGFMVPARNVRGQVVRLDAALNAVLAAHPYPEPLIRLLAEALTVTALVGAAIGRDDGQVTMQARGHGPVSLMVCDWRAGELRGYLQHAPAWDEAGATDLAAVFGDATLAVTVDQATTNERWQGIVPLEGAHLADALAGWFGQSEQVPTLIKVAVAGSRNTGWLAGGLIAQHLARAEIGGERLDAGEQHPDWTHVETLAATTTAAELADAALSAEELLWRLFHEEQVRITPGPTPVRGCRCSMAHIRDVLMRFPDAERADMRGPDGRIPVDCQFCSRVFQVMA